MRTVLPSCMLTSCAEGGVGCWAKAGVGGDSGGGGTGRDDRTGVGCTPVEVGLGAVAGCGGAIPGARGSDFAAAMDGGADGAGAGTGAAGFTGGGSGAGGADGLADGERG